ncbi:autotransporter domain-containing protein [Termitidicoccus mucosus]|uniref:Autotransporter domain-containing protein n=1 Tax=Termitidicoccus mucosus TaxID=1184151 RepID=A0A178ILL8_9BACT|nr:hypothetical protein AW736_06140 [Opitutaceae bacterium TSB47]
MKTLRAFTRCLFLAFGLQAFSLLLPAANIYWDPGVTGTWFTPNGWREGSATGALRGAPLDTDSAYIGTGHVTIGTGVLAANATLYVGYGASSSGTLVIEAGGVDWTTSNGYIGYSSGGSLGRAIVGGLMHIGSYLITGYSGTGYLDITSSGTVQAIDYLNFGHTAAGRGFANVEGTLDVGSYMLLGRQGQGTMDVASGGVVSISTYLDVGQSAGSVGLLNLAGSLSAGTYINIGGNGAGTVNVTPSGSMRATGTTSIGNGAGSRGTLDVAGTYVGNGEFRIGGSGTGTLMLRDGGSVRVGTGTITLAQAATGLLEIAGASAGAITGTNGTSPVTITGGAGSARVLFSHSDANYTFANNLAGSLAVEVNGGGLTTLTGSNNYTGGTIVRSGTLAGSTASIRGDSILVDGALLLDTPDAHSLTLTGTGAFNKLGAGSLTLTPASSFTGAFIVAAGAVTLSGAATLDNTRAVTLAFGGTLTGSLARTAGQTLSAAAGSAITGNVSFNNTTLALAPASPGAAAFSIGGNLTFADSTLKLGLFDASDSIIDIGGTVSIAGVNTIDLTLGMSGSYTLSGLGALAGSTITIDGAAQGGLRQTAFTTAAGADLLILFDADISRSLIWTGSASALWNVIDDNWTGSNNTKNYAALDTVIFDGVTDAANPANRTITLTQNTRVSDITVSGDADYTFDGAGGITSGTTIITASGSANLTGVTGKLNKSGAGTLTFENTGANNFVGGIEISGGAIVFNDVAQLGTATVGGGHAPISFTGSGGTFVGVLSGTGALAAEVSIAGAATATLDIADGTLELAAGVSGAGALEKTGDGTLTITGDAVHTGAVTITGGTLAAGGGNLRGASITNNAALALGVGDAGAVYSGAMTGTGAFFKIGTGALEVTGAITVDTVTISQGALAIKPAATLAAAAAFHIAPGAALHGTGAFSAPQLTNAGVIKVGRAANQAAQHGVMTFTGNYTGAAGAEIRLDMSFNANGAMEFDRFIINGNADGVTRLSLQEQPSAERLKGDTSLLPALGDMLTVTGSVAPDAFVHDGTVEFGGGQYRWDFSLNGGAGGWRTLVIEPASAFGMLDAAVLLIGRASFASIENRLLAARETNTGQKKHLWAAGLQRSENLGAVRYDHYETSPRADADTQGIQAGIDWFADRQGAFIFGLFVDYAKSDMHLPGRTTYSRATSTGYGMYGAWNIGGLHVDARLRLGSEKYNIGATRVAPFATTGYSWGGSFSAGYDIALGKTGKWRLEPAARFVYQEHNIEGATDAFGRHYDVDSANSRETRLGLRLSREGVWKNGLKCAPYIHAGWLYDFGGEGRLVVARETFNHNFGGGGAELGGGLLFELRRNITLQAGFAWFDTASTQGTTATAGIAIAW